MKFLADVNVPRAFAAWLTAQGFPCTHTLDFGLAQSRDEAIWAYAATEGLIIISKDEDFARLHARDPQGPIVIWLRTGNGSGRGLIAHLAPMWSTIIARLQDGDRLVEVR